MSGLSTHVLDLARGKPAAGVRVRLERLGTGEPEGLARAETDADGRVGSLLPQGRDLEEGVYRLVFDSGAYFSELDVETFYPEIAVTFRVSRPREHHHVPLLLSPWGYSTYRGS